MRSNQPLRHNMPVGAVEKLLLHVVVQAGPWRALYQCALPMLNAEEEAERVLAELKGAVRGKLVVAANTTGGMYIIPPPTKL